MLNATITAFAEDAETAAETAATAGFDWNGLWNTVLNWMLNTGVKLVIAVVLMIVTFKLVNVFTKRLYKRLQKKQVDETIARVSTQVLRIGLKILILVCLVGYVGIETASISAVIASIGVGISLAVQGTLSNFAGGVIIIVMRPFKIGDYILSDEYEGTVEDIKLFYTHLVTPDNKAVMIPNGTLANNAIVNYSAKDTRRLDVKVPIAYDADLDRAKSVIGELCEQNELVMKEPAPYIVVSEMSDSAIVVMTRVWCNRADYWTLYFGLLDAVKRALDENGIEIPYNKLDVTLKQKDDAND